MHRKFQLNSRLIRILIGIRKQGMEAVEVIGFLEVRGLAPVLMCSVISGL